MKKLFNKPLHVATLCILVVVGILYWYSGEQQQRYDTAATAYLRSALADIGSWQNDALQRQLAPEALAAIDAAHRDALLARYRSLGTFTALDNLQFGRLAAALSLFGSNTLLSYSGQARFQNGSAHFTATLVRREQRFWLYNINFGEPRPLDAPATGDKSTSP